MGKNRKMGMYNELHWKNTSMDVIPEELWASIPGYEGLYEASTLGRIKILERDWGYPGYKKTTGVRILTQTMNPWGYVYVELSDINKRRKKSFVHVMAARSWIANPENKPTVNHKYGIKHDNRVSELEWNTRSENTLHGYKIGLLRVNKTALGKKGALNKNSIPIYQCDMEGSIIKRWPCQAEAGRDLRIRQGNINSALKGRYKSCGGFIWKYANK